MEHRQAPPPGFTLDEAGNFDLDFRKIQPSAQRFFVTGFKLLRDSEEFLFLFGQNSRFATSNSDHFHLAIEITMDSHSVWRNLVDGVWNGPSTTSPLPMINSVESGLTKSRRAEAESYRCLKELPREETWKYTRRTYQADVASTYVWGIHGAIEFINFPSSLITTWRKHKSLRDGDSATSLLTVVLTRTLLYSFFLQTKELFTDGEFEPENGE